LFKTLYCIDLQQKSAMKPNKKAFDKHSIEVCEKHFSNFIFQTIWSLMALRMKQLPQTVAIRKTKTGFKRSRLMLLKTKKCRVKKRALCRNS
jgi:hypothetical protein